MYSIFQQLMENITEIDGDINHFEKLITETVLKIRDESDEDKRNSYRTQLSFLRIAVVLMRAAEAYQQENNVSTYPGNIQTIPPNTINPNTIPPYTPTKPKKYTKTVSSGDSAPFDPKDYYTSASNTAKVQLSDVVKEKISQETIEDIIKEFKYKVFK